MAIIYMLLIPLLLVVLSLAVKEIKALGRLNVLGHLSVLLLAFILIRQVVFTKAPVSLFNFFYLDALSVFFILVTAMVNFAASLYSIQYLEHDILRQKISEKKARVYYILFNLFSISMFFVAMVNNVGMLWAGIEMTTLVSAFLVGFYNTKPSVEAAWKYLIICSVGIILALLGTVMFSYAVAMTSHAKSLNWQEMVSLAVSMDPKIVRIAFIFILVGYGTKAGLAPMHTWLPDAHSQAIAPASAMLSGVLLKTAVYAILRYSTIINKCLGSDYFSHLMIFFGLISLGISAAFILVQRDIKRLLAYSSIEHIGIISIGFGLGGALGTFGAFFHLFNHALAKSLMFFGAGNIISRYQRHNLNGIRGVISAMPFTGVMMILGVFALAGFPPFPLFSSELMIIIEAFMKGSILTAILLLSFIVVVFSALIYHFGKILFGKLPNSMAVIKEPLSGKCAFIFLLLPLCWLGIAIPGALEVMIEQAMKVLAGG